MKMYMIAIKDLAAQCFMQPSFVHATGIAVREFSDMINNPETMFSKHPSDFEMYSVGEYTDSDASFFIPEKPQLLARAKDLKTSQPAVLGDLESRN